MIRGSNSNPFRPTATSQTPRPPKSEEQIEQEFANALVVNSCRLAGVEKADTPVPRLPNIQASAVTSAYLVASELLGPVQALAVAGATFFTKNPNMVDIVDKQYESGREKIGELEGSSASLYAQPSIPMAATSGKEVYLNPQLVEHQGTPVVDWIIGHELGHIQSQDGLQAIGRSVVIGHLEKDGIQGPVLDQAKVIHEALNKESEFESDREGFDYAVAQGHSPESIISSTAAFLDAISDGQKSVGSHPASDLRIASLKDYAGSNLSQ